MIEIEMKVDINAEILGKLNQMDRSFPVVEKPNVEIEGEDWQSVFSNIHFRGVENFEKDIDYEMESGVLTIMVPEEYISRLNNGENVELKFYDERVSSYDDTRINLQVKFKGYDFL